MVFTLSISANIYSQNAKVTIQKNNVSVQEILDEIESSTELRFFLLNEQINTDRKVDINVRETSVDKVLDILFKGNKIKYNISKNNLVLLQEDKGIKDISGKVTDSEGVSLPGVSVMLKDSENGTVTNANGEFQLSNVKSTDILQFSFVGMIPHSITVGNKISFNVILESDTYNLEEIVAVGYATQKKVNLTGATTVVKKEQMENRPVAQVSRVLQGVVPGLSISATNAGGEPDAAMNWQIRGQGTPYILVDGIPMDINNVNPNDIESVSVLKDAASAAIYGARAAYGVVLITTKSGKKGMKKPQITYSNNIAYSTPTILPEPMNSLEFAEWWNTSATNSGAGKIFSDEVIQRIRAFKNDPGNSPSTAPDPNSPNKWGRMMHANANTNWFDVFYEDWEMRQQHNISVKGGSDKSKYYLSGGFFDHQGQMAFGDDEFQRYSTAANFSSEITKWFKVGLKTKFTRSVSDWPQDAYGGTGLGRKVLFHDIARRWPTDPVKTPDGQWGEMSRIHIYESGARDKYEKNVLWLTFDTELEPIKNWKINASYTFHNKNQNRSNHQPVVYMNDIEGNPYITFDLVPPSQISKTFVSDKYERIDLYTSYELKYEEHTIKLLAGHNRESGTYNSLTAAKQDIITDAVPSLSTAIGRMTNGDGNSSWATMGYFSRLNYNYKNKYLLELNGRYDGSHKFKEEDRWGFFPSVSVGYRVSEEEFFKPLTDYIPYLKLRASYGSLGDQNGSAYSYLSVMGINSEIKWLSGDKRPATVYMPGILSESLTWETLTTVDYGVDASFLNNRLSATFDWFKKERTDIITNGKPLPALLGTSAPSVNGNSLETKGWELSLAWKDKIGDDFKYGIAVNISDYKKIITKTDNPDGLLSKDYVGKEVGEIWGYESDGLFQSQEEIDNSASQKKIYGAWYPGDVKYKDLNNDGEISNGKYTLEDHGDLKVIGNSQPRYFYNINVNAEWKGFDFTMFWSGIGKRDIWFNHGTNMFWGQTWSGNIWSSSAFKPHLDYWRTDNTDAYFPRLAYDANKNRKTSTRYLQSAAYLRLKNIQLGYKIPSRYLNKFNIQNLRIYFSAENLLTFTKLHEGFDPESFGGGFGYGKAFPLSKTLSFGINITM